MQFYRSIFALFVNFHFWAMSKVQQSHIIASRSSSWAFCNWTIIPCEKFLRQIIQVKWLILMMTTLYAGSYATTSPFIIVPPLLNFAVTLEPMGYLMLSRVKFDTPSVKWSGPEVGVLATEGIFPFTVALRFFLQIRKM